MPYVAAPPTGPAPPPPADAPAQTPIQASIQEASEAPFPANDELGRWPDEASADQDDSHHPQRALSPPLHGPQSWPAATDEEQDVRLAAAELAAAESEHWQREFELADAEGAVDAARDRSDWLDSQRIQARRDRVTAERHLEEAQSAQRSAVRAVEDARRALEAAERRLRSTREPPAGDSDS
jgi:hypothetical protein